jgi:putative DNA primase/helicase
LENRYLNAVPDMSNADLEESGLFKAIVGEDLIQAERKGQHPFTFRPWAKCVFSCNGLPDSAADDSNAFYRRWIMLTFGVDFTGREDRDLLERITTEDELSGLLNAGLKAWEEAKARNSFTGAEDVATVRRRYIAKSNSIKAFMSHFEYDAESVYTKSSFWRAYAKFCVEDNIIQKTETAFWRYVKNEAEIGERGKVSGYDKPQPLVVGLRYNGSARVETVFTILVSGDSKKQSLEMSKEKTIATPPSIDKWS